MFHKFGQISKNQAFKKICSISKTEMDSQKIGNDFWDPQLVGPLKADCIDSTIFKDPYSIIFVIRRCEAAKNFEYLEEPYKILGSRRAPDIDLPLHA
uniref:Uncharacterized protein n=1 Tax=Romanomermis culicivorax TaxID=13658 RepID=A0A915I3Y4_ROMCU